MTLLSTSRDVIKTVIPSSIRKKIRNFIDPPQVQPVPTYNHDNLITYGKSVEWMNDPVFKRAYSVGMDSGHKIGREPGSKTDIHIEWRAHICCWAARHALLLNGDFVECGVNTGIMSLTICNLLEFEKVDRKFFLFDTYQGIPVEQMSVSEKEIRLRDNSRLYEDCYDTTKANFSRFKNVILVPGRVPDSLSFVDIKKVAYLHLDMNIAFPEVEAANYFWDKLLPGAIVVLDDYGWLSHSEQRIALDSFARKKGVYIATLPTGQGLLLKPL
jgi:O-methyltransferase